MSKAPPQPTAPRRASIQRKQMIVVMLTTLVALVVACGTLTFVEVVNYRQGMVRNFSILAEFAAKHSSLALQFNDSHDAEKTLRYLGMEPGVEAAWILTSEGKIFVEYPREAARRTAPPLLAEGEHRFAAGTLDLHCPIRSGSEVIGSVCLRTNTQGLNRHLQEYALIALAVLAGSSLVAFLFAAWMQRRLVMSAGPMDRVEGEDGEMKPELDVHAARIARLQVEMKALGTALGGKGKYE
jgi:hypothetical protein